MVSAEYVAQQRSQGRRVAEGAHWDMLSANAARSTPSIGMYTPTRDNASSSKMVPTCSASRPLTHTAHASIAVG